LSALYLKSLTPVVVFKSIIIFGFNISAFALNGMPSIISIEGHHRLEAAILLDQETIPVYIVDWIDTTNTSEHLDCIINLNNGNRPWLKVDYLKAFAKENKDYKIVYDAYLSNSNNISVGNVINCFFGKSVNQKFKKGECKIEDINFSLMLLNKFSDLISKFGSNKIQAYCVRELITVSFIKAKKDTKAIEYLFKIYEEWAMNNHYALTSISRFKPEMEEKLNYYNLKLNESNR